MEGDGGGKVEVASLPPPHLAWSNAYADIERTSGAGPLQRHIPLPFHPNLGTVVDTRWNFDIDGLARAYPSHTFTCATLVTWSDRLASSIASWTCAGHLEPTLNDKRPSSSSVANAARLSLCTLFQALSRTRGASLYWCNRYALGCPPACLFKRNLDHSLQVLAPRLAGKTWTRATGTA